MVVCPETMTAGINILSRVPHLGFRHPLANPAVSDSFPRSNTKMRNLVPATFVADLNIDQLRWGCQRSTMINGGVSGQNKVGNLGTPGLRRLRAVHGN